MLVKKTGCPCFTADAMQISFRISNSSQSDNYVYCDLNNRTSDLLSSSTETVLKL